MTQNRPKTPKYLFDKKQNTQMLESPDLSGQLLRWKIDSPTLKKKLCNFTNVTCPFN